MKASQQIYAKIICLYNKEYLWFAISNAYKLSVAIFVKGVIPEDCSSEVNTSGSLGMLSSSIECMLPVSKSLESKMLIICPFFGTPRR